MPAPDYVQEALEEFEELAIEARPIWFHTPQGLVEIFSLRWNDELGCVETYTQDNEETPAYRIYNPPSHVADLPSSGEPETLREGEEPRPSPVGLRYAPLEALVITIGQHGGVRR